MKFEVLTSGRAGPLATIIGYREIQEGVTQMDEDKKPTIEELEKAIGTPDEMDIMPDGSVQKKHKIEPCVGSDDFKEDCFALRARIEETKIQTLLVIEQHPVFADDPKKIGYTHPAADALSIEQYGEMIANLKLAFRHLEDAQMRFGKAIQAFDGGKSVYPR